MALSEVVGSVLARALGTVGMQALTAALRRRQAYLQYLRRFGRTLATHYAELEPLVREMPFIYKDMGRGLVETDFVAADTETLDPITLSPQEQRRHIEVTLSDRLLNRPKALWLGGAGTGKTTFFRRTALDLIKGKKPQYFYAAENPIPVYVPLKLADNTAPSPIARLIRSNSIFVGADGLRRLISYAEARRLLLLLDGYDEIARPVSTYGEQINYLQEELTYVFSVDVPPETINYLDPKVIDFYTALRNSRIWLSTRPEFLAQNPIGALRSPNSQLRITAIAVRGVGRNRRQLATTIFDKYRQRHSAYLDVLSEEYFLQEIDASKDEELIALSKVPLFLTVMCYVYASLAIQKLSHEVDWIRGVQALMIECIRLLLHDLDESKARDLPVAAREALLRRRNDHAAAKYAYLCHFAAQVFQHDVAVFDMAYVVSSANEYFRDLSTDSRRHEILASLERFCHEILYAGVFIDVPGRPGYLDFPHRRFREALAVEHVRSSQSVPYLLGNLTKPGVRELLYVWFGLSEAQDVTLQTLLADAADGRLGGLGEEVLAGCLARLPRHFNPSGQLESFLMRCIDRNISPIAPSLILPFCSGSPGLLRHVVSSWTASLAAGRPAAFSICSEVLARFETNTLEALAKAGFRDAMGSTDIRPAFLRHALAVSDIPFLTDVFEQSRADTEGFEDFAYGMATRPPNEAYAAGYLALWGELTADQRAVMCWFARRYNRPAVIGAREKLSSSWTPFMSALETLEEIEQIPHTGDRADSNARRLLIERRRDLEAADLVGELLYIPGDLATQVEEEWQQGGRNLKAAGWSSVDMISFQKTSSALGGIYSQRGLANNNLSKQVVRKLTETYALPQGFFLAVQKAVSAIRLRPSVRPLVRPRSDTLSS